MNKSETIGEISKAIVKAWGDMQNPKHNREVEVLTKKGGKYTFEYTDLGGILDEAKRVYKDNGIAVIQDAYTNEVNGKSILSVDTELLHESGEWIKSKPLSMPANQGIQDLGGQITYLKRYSLSAMLGISTEKDDDANGANGNSYQEEGPKRRQRNEQPDKGPATPEQLGILKTKALEYAKARNRKVDEVYQVMNIPDLTGLNSVQADSAITQLNMWLDGIKKEG